MGKLILFASLATLGLAQDQPVIRVQSRLVQLNVVVRNKFGPIRDLTAADFTLLDQGKPRKIALFAAPSPPDATALPSAPQGTASNRLPGNSGPRNVTVVLLDFLNTGASSRMFGQQQLISFLKTLDGRQPVAVYVLGNQLLVLHDFTENMQELIQSAARYRGGSIGVPVAASSSPSLPPSGLGSTRSNFMADAFISMDEMGKQAATQNAAETTLAVLDGIANHLAIVPGRKNLIWMSNSFPISVKNGGILMAGSSSVPGMHTGGVAPEVASYQESIARVARSLNRADVAIYPVDLRGVGRLSSTLSAASRGTTTASSLSPIDSNLETMKQLASQTGGRAFYDTNDLAGAIKNAFEDADGTYVLGFYPDESELDSKYHSLKVSVNRPAAETRFRPGYYADPERKPPDREFKARVNEAVNSSLDSNAVGVTAEVAPPVPGEPPGTQLTVKVNLDDLKMEHSAGRWTGNLQVVFEQQTRDGRNLTGSFQSADLQLLDATYQLAQTEGLVFKANVTPAPSAAQIRVVVADRNTGSIGSVLLPLTKSP